MGYEQDYSGSELLNSWVDGRVSEPLGLLLVQIS